MKKTISLLLLLTALVAYAANFTCQVSVGAPVAPDNVSLCLGVADAAEITPMPPNSSMFGVKDFYLVNPENIGTDAAAVTGDLARLSTDIRSSDGGVWAIAVNSDLTFYFAAGGQPLHYLVANAEGTAGGALGNSLKVPAGSILQISTAPIAEAAAIAQDPSNQTIIASGDDGTPSATATLAIDAEATALAINFAGSAPVAVRIGNRYYTEDLPEGSEALPDGVKWICSLDGLNDAAVNGFANGQLDLTVAAGSAAATVTMTAIDKGATPVAVSLTSGDNTAATLTCLVPAYDPMDYDQDDVLIAGDFSYVPVGADTAMIVGYDNAKAKTVAIPTTLGGYTVSIIGRHAFKGNAVLTSITLPETLERIGEGAFQGMAKLAAIHIPASVVQIDQAAFAQCPALKTITVADANENYVGKDGALYTTGYETLVAVPGSAANLAIPATTTAIAPSALTGCAKLKALAIPAAVAEIGEEAFANCTALAVFTVAAENGHFTAVDGILYTKDKTELVAVPGAYAKPLVLPATVTAIRKGAAAGCAKFKAVTLNAGLATIGERAFDHAAKLAAVTIPASVTEIGPGAFANCSALKAIHVAQGNPAYSSANGLLLSADGTRLLAVPGGFPGALAIPASVTELAENCAEGCTAITAVTFPVGIDAIPPCAFYGCTKLATVTVPGNVTAIGDEAFANCTALKTLRLSEGLLELGDDVFRGCKGLAAATLPSSLEDLAISAFENCAGLKSLTFLGMPPDLSDMAELPPKCVVYGYASNGWNAGGIFCGAAVKALALDFSYVVDDDDTVAITGLANEKATALAIPAMLEGLPVARIAPAAFQGKSKVKSVTIPGTVQTIGDSAFADCTALADFTLGDGLVTIGMDAFGGCAKLKSIAIPATVEEILPAAFDGCSALTAIAIPAATTEIGGGAFSNCKSLKTITVAEGNPVFAAVGGALYALDHEESCATLFFVPATIASFTIPAEVAGLPVTAIGDSAFNGSAKLKALAIPEGVTTIGNFACFNCSALATVSIPASADTLGEAAFANCKSLKTVTVAQGNPVYAVLGGALYALDGEGQPEVLLFTPAATAGVFSVPATVTRLGMGAFAGCAKLTAIHFPDGIDAIPSGLCLNCTGLTEVFLPDGVLSIGPDAFNGCAKLASIVMPSSITAIGATAFYNCKALATLNLPDDLQTIGEGAFNGCAKLARIAIPAGVESIGAHAFDNCKKLLDIFFLGDEAPGVLGVTTLQAKTVVHAAWNGSYGVLPKSGTPVRTTAFTPATPVLDIDGQEELVAGGKANFTLTVDENAKVPAWSIAYGAKSAKIDKNGVLTAGKSDLAQTIVVRAIYAIGGCPYETTFNATLAATQYPVTAVGANASTPAAAMGAEVTVTAVIPDGENPADYIVAWTFSPKLDFAADGLAATFIMPNKAVKATAKVTRKPGRPNAAASLAAYGAQARAAADFTLTWTAPDGAEGAFYIVSDAAVAAAILDADPTAQVASLDDAAWTLALPAGATLRASDTALVATLPDGTATSADGFTASADTTLVITRP